MYPRGREIANKSMSSYIASIELNYTCRIISKFHFVHLRHSCHDKFVRFDSTTFKQCVSRFKRIHSRQQMVQTLVLTALGLEYTCPWALANLRPPRAAQFHCAVACLWITSNYDSHIEAIGLLYSTGHLRPPRPSNSELCFVAKF